MLETGLLNREPEDEVERKPRLLFHALLAVDQQQGTAKNGILQGHKRGQRLALEEQPNRAEEALGQRRAAESAGLEGRLHLGQLFRQPLPVWTLAACQSMTASQHGGRAHPQPPERSPEHCATWGSR